MPPEDDSQTVVEPPSPVERHAFRLLPLVWIGVFVLAGVILYAVLK
jgi:hypothetical protein